MISVLTDVRPTIETYPLEQAAEGYARMLSGDARFRVVLDHREMTSSEDQSQTSTNLLRRRIRRPSPRAPIRTPRRRCDSTTSCSLVERESGAETAAAVAVDLELRTRLER